MRQTSTADRALPIAETLERHVQVLRHHHLTALDETQETAEAIHKARVTTRRLQADLDLIQFGRNSRVVRNVKQRLRDFRNGLSALRNYDVFIEIVHAALERADDEDIPDLALLAGRLRAERDREAKQAGKVLGHFKVKLIASLLSRPGENEEKEQGLDFRALNEAKIRRRASGRLEDRLSGFLALVYRLQDTSDAEGIHQLRIAAKRLRYLVETLTELGFREPKGAIRWLRVEQGRIGDWHDLFCLEEEVLRLVGKKEALHGRLDESAALLRATAKLLKARDIKASRMFPVKPPNYFERSIRRLVGEVRGRAIAPTEPRA